ncbi:MAG: hypothetical protein WCH13_04370 [Deltaproteobacteria bacterium]
MKRQVAALPRGLENVLARDPRVDLKFSGYRYNLATGAVKRVC